MGIFFPWYQRAGRCSPDICECSSPCELHSQFQAVSRNLPSVGKEIPCWTEENQFENNEVRSRKSFASMTEGQMDTKSEFHSTDEEVQVICLASRSGWEIKYDHLTCLPLKLVFAPVLTRLSFGFSACEGWPQESWVAHLQVVSF